MAEGHPGWVNGITASEARLATGLLVAAHGVGDALGPLKVRTGIRDAGGHPGLVTRNVNKLTVNPFQAVIADPAQPADGPYLVTMDTAKELEVDPAEENLHRIDRVVAEVIDTEPGFRVSVYKGQSTSSATPPKPAVDNRRSLILAEVRTFPTGQQSPDPDDTRSFTAALNGIVPVRNENDLPEYPHGSMLIYRMDTGAIQVSRNGDWVDYRPPPLGDTAWKEPQLQDFWKHYTTTPGSGFVKAGYMRSDDGWVRLRGLIRWDSTAAIDNTRPIFQLPLGYRPPGQHLFPAATQLSGSEAKMGRIDISINGNVLPTVVNKNWVSLDGIAFTTY